MNALIRIGREHFAKVQVMEKEAGWWKDVMEVSVFLGVYLFLIYQFVDSFGGDNNQ